MVVKLSSVFQQLFEYSRGFRALREVACLKVVSSKSSLHSGVLGTVHAPTLEVASVKLFKVVDLPLEGFPTRPIRGSRGIMRVDAGI